MKLIILFGLPLFMAWLVYFVPKKLGYPRIGKVLLGLYLALLASVIFDDYFFTENDARKLLAEQGIILADRATIKDNRTSSVLDQYYHEFNLSISHRDKQNLIRQITSSYDFIRVDTTIEGLNSVYLNNDSDSAHHRYYEDQYYYINEYYKSGKDGYAPTYRIVRISKQINNLQFEEF